MVRQWPREKLDAYQSPAALPRYGRGAAISKNGKKPLFSAIPPVPTEGSKMAGLLMPELRPKPFYLLEPFWVLLSG